MHGIPRDRAFDSTIALRSEGYLFISNRCRRLGSDVFRTRLMLQPVTCMLGEDAASLFYESGRMTRVGGMPKPTLRLLQDEESVQTLDGAVHRHRKRMFMELMSERGLAALLEIFVEEWRGRMLGWRAGEPVVLIDEAEAILCRAGCRWAGMSLDRMDASRRTRELRAMIEGAGSLGPRNWWGHLLRARTERWARRLVRETRRDNRSAAPRTPLEAFSAHRDPRGHPLPDAVVAVELLNLIRPIVAIARYIVFAALALHRHPHHAERVARGSDDEIVAFVNEVRRFYPFFPFIGGRATRDTEIGGGYIEAGDWALLDLYGTNHDPRLWQDPETFRPERFDGEEPATNALIPQGGGDHFGGHRCAGEWLTLAVVCRTLGLLTTEMRYTVPEQNLAIDFRNIPAAPASGFVILPRP